MRGLTGGGTRRLTTVLRGTRTALVTTAVGLTVAIGTYVALAGAVPAQTRHVVAVVAGLVVTVGLRSRA